jgi:peptidoglycan/LPS O-acetylase OafA/YrhL
MPKSKTELTPLTGIRFFLALWVVLFHQAFYLGTSWISLLPGPFPKLIRAGYMAVGVFFVLSGFVLSYNYDMSRPWIPARLKQFAVSRFARIYPAYSIGLLLCTPWVIVLLLKQHTLTAIGSEIGKSVMALTLLQSWAPTAAESWNGPGWSLSAEAFFYCCFPFIGVALWRLSRPWQLVAAGVAVWVAALLAPAIAVVLAFRSDAGVPAVAWTSDTSGAWVNFIKFNPVVHLPEFCMGILAGRAYQILRARGTNLFGRGYWLYLPGLLLEAIAITTCHGSLYLFLHNGLLLPLHALVILGLALGGGVLAWTLSIRPLVILGHASYSMYIFQVPVAGWTFFTLKHLFSLGPEGSGATALYLAVLIGFSVLIFIKVEGPANFMLKRKLASPHGPQETIGAFVAAEASQNHFRATAR